MAFKAALEADKDAPESWSKYMNVVYNGRKEPSIGSYDPDKLEAKAREVTASTQCELSRSRTRYKRTDCAHASLV